jgi:hypothetical protein
MLCRVTIKHNSKPKSELEMCGPLAAAHSVII